MPSPMRENINAEKIGIIESLHKIMCSATTTAVDARVANNDYFKRRVLGFKAEIEYVREVTGHEGVQFLEGGQFISRKLSGEAIDRNHFIYVTLAFNEAEDFADLYSRIARWNEVEDLIYIRIERDGWSTTPVTVREGSGRERTDREAEIVLPSYTFHTFNKTTSRFELCTTQDFGCVLSKFQEQTRTPALYPLRKREQFDYFSQYDTDVLKSIYANRYFLDVILRKASGRQIIDLDGFLSTVKGYYVVEIKEKSPIVPARSTTTDWRFGWDSRRILWYLYLQTKVGFPIIYNVREIDNRTDRNFVRWDSIFMDDFLKGTSWSNSRGGGGGEDTLLAPYSFFESLETLLGEIV